jgi:hypothetical protein
MQQAPKAEQPITIRFPAEVLQGIREAARTHERSFNGEVVWALRQYLERLQREQERQS